MTRNTLGDYLRTLNKCRKQELPLVRMLYLSLRRNVDLSPVDMANIVHTALP